MDLKETTPKRATVLKRLESSWASAIMTVIFGGVGVVVPFAIQMQTRTDERMIWLVALVGPVVIALLAAANRATMGMVIHDLWHGSPAGSEISFGLCLARVLMGMMLAPIYPVSLVVALLDPQRRT